MPDVLPFLPYGRQSIGQEDIDAVVAALRSDWLTQGPYVQAFEQAFAKRACAQHAVACASGTAALHIAALALDLKPGDAVIVPAITFLATANAARYAGAEVVFSDVDPDTALMQNEHVAQAVTHARALGLRPRAVFPVHFAGQPACIGESARAYGLDVVEDACHAVGTRVQRGSLVEPVGSCPDGGMAVFSFHPVKTITAGEGGAVTTNDGRVADRLRRLRHHGMVREPTLFQSPDAAFAPDGSPNPWYHEMPELGFNYRLTDLQCALALSQLGRLDEFVRRRQELMSRYDERLQALAPLIQPLARSPAGPEIGWHLCVALIEFDRLGISRAQAMSAMRAQGIGTQVHYIPVHWQPYYVARYGRRDLPGAAAYYRRCLSLPLYASLRDDDVDRVTTALAQLVDNRQAVPA